MNNVLKKRKIDIRLCTWVLVLATGIISRGVMAYDGGRDTTHAMVVYDDPIKMLPGPEYSSADYSLLVDSVLALDSVPLNVLTRLEVYRDLAAIDPAELPAVVDTIFDSPHVTKEVINAVTTYLSAMEEFGLVEVATPAFAHCVPYDNSPYPANFFYGDWNVDVPNPIRNNLTLFDSTMTLVLTDSVWGCDFYPPVIGVITSRFGWRYGRNHNGIDIDLEVWDPVHAAFGGVVRVARYYGGYGRVVVIRHHNGLETIYAHLHRFKVEPGDVVEAGDVVGLGGSSGHSTGSHLHFEIRFQGVPIRPSQVVDFITFTLRSSTVKLRRAGSFLAAAPDGKEYEVRRGDYLYKIAREYGLSLDEICTLNGIRQSDYLRVGQVLIVGS